MPVELAVDVIIATHSPDRPVERAVASVLAGGLPASLLRVTVVAHGLPVEDVEARLRPLAVGGGDLPDGVRVLPLVDGIASPAGPFNHGLGAATATYVSVMGSDDTVDPGTYAAWLALARRHRSAAVLAAVRTTAHGRVPTPVVRPGRSLDLDPLRDGLVYRTAPLGLVARSEVDRLDLRFTPGLASGEDQEFTARLWFGGGRLDYARWRGNYVVHDDAASRVTLVRRDVPTLFEFATRLVDGDWFPRQDPKVREALVTKFLRVHVIPAVWPREANGGWSPADRAAVAAVVTRLLRAAPDAERSLSTAERSAVAGLADPVVPTVTVLEQARAARAFHRAAALTTADLVDQARPDAPLRHVAASATMRLTDRAATTANRLRRALAR